MNSRKSRRRTTLRARRKKQVKRAKELGLELGEATMYKETQVYDYIFRFSLNTERGYRNLQVEGKEIDTLSDSKVLTFLNKKGEKYRKAVPYTIKVVQSHKHLSELPVTKYVKKDEKVSTKKKA